MKIQLLIYILMSTFFSICRATDPISWQKSEIEIDGKINDWGNNLRFYDNDLRLFYELTNDSNFLYIAIKCNDEFMQREIIEGGMDLSFNIKSKPRIETYISIKREGGMPPVGFDPDIHENPGKDINSPLMEKKLLIEAHGFIHSPTKLPSNNSDPETITIAMNIDASNVLVYEIRIPFRDFYDDGYNLQDISEDLVKFTLQLNAINRPNMQEGAMGTPPSGGMKQGRMSGPPSGGMQGGMGGPPPGGGMSEPPPGDNGGVQPGNNGNFSSSGNQSFKYKFFISNNS